MSFLLTFGYHLPPASLFSSHSCLPTQSLHKVTGSLEAKYWSVFAENIRSSGNYLFLTSWWQWESSAFPSLRQGVQTDISSFTLKTEHSLFYLSSAFSLLECQLPRTPCSLSQNKDLPSEISEVMSKPSVWLRGFSWC